MDSNRKVILFIATSLDGFIADPDGGIEWLQKAESVGNGDNGFGRFYDTVDTLFMGRKTYDHLMTLVDEFPHQDKEAYVFTRSDRSTEEHVNFVDQDMPTFVQNLKQQEGKNLWLVGGADLTDEFMQNQLIDEMIITIIPVVLGKGIPLFKSTDFSYDLELHYTERFGDFMQLHYKVKK
ncbi:dihydrofolate reductase [Halalkalibacillus sediminis]|uniref:Dihydrofolate reductase n=1 Tax=Halalkalibacillus sediminis TaxID=2018042 RepID=A0A2I0QUQ4_9BACI|nr:dihydrofolate reductase family protein [Halalkalibacillus sediminis]PKR78024.1 dihydrofolate reductase [Halalkalibacillus sediminis]